jgi:DNA-binding transcriptional LysR family regulator
MTTRLDPPLPRRFVRHGMLPQLAAFEAVVRMGSARRAAHSLCIAQPTLSGHLRKLGDALGVRLFAQQGRQLVPTEAALVLLDTARQVFSALDQCDRALSQSRQSAAAVSVPVAQGTGPGRA